MNNSKIVVLSLILTCIVLTIWLNDSPFPNLLNWDLYEHQTLINLIRQGQIALFPSQLSDTFLVNAYTPLFHIIMAFLQTLTPFLSVLQFWWIAEKTFSFFMVLTTALLVWKVTHDEWGVCFGVVLGAFVFTPPLSNSPLFLMPQTLSALIWALSLIRLLTRFQKRSDLLDLPQVFFWMLILLLHFAVGSVGVLLQIGLIILLKLNSKPQFSKKLLGLFLLILSIIFLMVIIFNPYLRLDIFKTDESLFFNLNLWQKIELFKNWYGFFLPFFFGLGVWAVMKRNSSLEKALLVLSIAGITLVFLPFPYIIKLYSVAGFLIHLIMAAGFAFFISWIELKSFKVAIVFFTLVFFALIFISNQNGFKDVLQYNNTATNVSNYEIEAANFLKTHYADKKILLTSEPATQGIMEALSGINTQGGIFAQPSTREILSTIYQVRDARKIRSLLYQINDRLKTEDDRNLTVFVLSGRFFNWEHLSAEDKLNYSINVWAPTDLTYEAEDYINWLRDQDGFKMVFKNKGVAVFEVLKFDNTSH